MELLDYTGRLNDHDAYLNVLRQLERKCKYIEYTVISGDTSFADKFADSMISVKAKNRWWGTCSAQRRDVYTLRASQALFKHLEKFETFCKYSVSVRGDTVTETDFGINDIAFLDDGELPLLFTTTHEGYIMIRVDFLRAVDEPNSAHRV